MRRGKALDVAAAGDRIPEDSDLGVECLDMDCKVDHLFGIVHFHPAVVGRREWRDAPQGRHRVELTGVVVVVVAPEMALAEVDCRSHCIRMERPNPSEDRHSWDGLDEQAP